MANRWGNSGNSVRLYFSGLQNHCRWWLSSSRVQIWELGHKEGWVQRTDAFELWFERILKVPWTARRSNQSILKEISPEYSLEGLMLKLKLQYFGHLMWRTDSLGRTLMLGEIEGGRRREWQEMRWLDGISLSNGHESEQTPGDGEGEGSMVCCSPWGRKSQTWLGDWTATKILEDRYMSVLFPAISSGLSSVPAQKIFVKWLNGRPPPTGAF